MQFRILIMAAAACLALPACSTSVAMREQSQAATTPRTGDMMDLKSFDKNNDDTLVRSELEEGLNRNFVKADVNANNVLEPSEVRSFNERLHDQSAISPVIDWNADGKIIMAEFATQWHTMFARADIDRDGVVNPNELAGRVREYKPRKLPPPTFSGKDGRPPGSQ